ncbi:PREDICTED: uncharacterized protein LOC106747647 [Dinoponera quadriceps]|uniref:Uncharacterized protein LOC106747647 n=1 Tax=Dinoponera quadriceps TaxID=609295 RepID=A0A6P3XRJ4_DINQU|nr:PREDICTED: uncharacterized protein LOC106747647 [Dinoponera quadriceps]
MHSTFPALYAFRLSLNQVAGPTFFHRKTMVDRTTTTSAILLAAMGLSVSIFSLKKLQSQRRLRKA